MQFTFHKDVGDDTLKIDGDLHKYLFKVRRHNSNKNLFFRNMEDDILYEYQIISVNRRDTNFQLVNQVFKPIKPKKELHIGWCKIDIKNIEKMLPSLNEIGVTKITFINCDYSQNNIKINYEKLDKLLINSSSQSGRSDKIVFDVVGSLNEFKKLYSDCYMFNFSQNSIQENIDDIKTIVLGCEGGFSSTEIEIFNTNKIVGVNSDLILRSETAIIAIASKIIL
ncbi:MAG: 16S rRNA (uracil(1498)-N(3))-methyltransferase [Arcobacteraceae bacterium]|nr:16S rRNA (uracil(1498)-N(3))-methyltransferase [Arcobacteraceae bacterium]